MVGLAVFAGSYLVSSRRPALATAATPAGAVAEPAGSTVDDRLMLVVLPFEDLGGSGDPFTSGLSEEVRSRLASLDGLGVISRTTSRRFAANRPPVPELAAELAVDYVVDGTVRWETTEAGERRVRVTPQLVLAAQDRQLWTHSYDATVADVLEVWDSSGAAATLTRTP